MFYGVLDCFCKVDQFGVVDGCFERSTDGFDGCFGWFLMECGVLEWSLCECVLIDFCGGFFGHWIILFY